MCEGTFLLAPFVRLWGVGMSWSGWLASLLHNTATLLKVCTKQVGRRWS